jgi:hypothetical protein
MMTMILIISLSRHLGKRKSQAEHSPVRDIIGAQKEDARRIF